MAACLAWIEALYDGGGTGVVGHEVREGTGDGPGVGDIGRVGGCTWTCFCWMEAA